MTTPTRFDITAPIPRGTTLIEASAGTGKTWTLSALVTRLVAEEGIDLDELLVVTFSRAASQELRERVREQLEHVRARLRAEARADDDVLVQHLRVEDADEVTRRVARISAALASFDAATIATIHQFCHLVLKSLGVAGDSDSFATLVDDASQLRAEVTDDVYLRMRAEGGFKLPYKDAREVSKAALSHGTADLAPLPPPNALLARMTFARNLRRTYAQRKRRASLLEYDDLLLQLRDALRDPTSSAVERMRQRWSTILVDEFQDTDLVQWEVFHTAFGNARRALILVGDPKQAIYGFRGGDVHTYLRAAHGAEHSFTLPTNFRSDAPLVAALQQLIGDVAFSPNIVARRVDAHHQGRRVEGLAAHPIELRWHGDRRLNVGDVRRVLYPDVANRIAQMLSSGATFDGEPLAPHHLAVLTYARNDLVEIREELRRVGVPSVLMSEESVLRSTAGSWWLQLLLAIEQPHRSERVRAACLTPLVGWSVEALEAVGTGGVDESVAAIHRLRALFDAGGVAAVLDSLRADGLLGRVLERVGGERDITDIDHCAQLFTRFGLSHGGGITSLVSWLQDQIAQDATVTAESRIMRLDSDAHAVTLSTIHASKGLQYPVVLAPTLWDRWDKPETVPGIVNIGDSRHLHFDGDVVNSPDALEDVAAEAMRLAYVALTRAQSHLVVWWMPSQRNTRKSSLHRLLFGQAPTPDAIRALTAQRAQSTDAEPLLTVTPRTMPDTTEIREVLGAWQDGGAFEVSEIQPGLKPPSVTLPQDDRPLRVAHFDDSTLDRRWRRTSYSALTAAAEAQAAAAGVVPSEPEWQEAALDPDEDLPQLSAPAPSGAELSPMATMPAGATFGSLVHGVLETVDFGADDLPTALREAIVEQLASWPVEVDVEELAQALNLVMTTPMGPQTDEVTLTQIRSSDCLAEMEFELPLAGGDDPHAQATLGDFAGLLREHLDAHDPLAAYAEELLKPPLGQQPLRGYLTGSVDLTFRHNGRFFVVDYKTNRLGDPAFPVSLGAYAPHLLNEAMMHSSYPLQAILYSVVLHRYLRWRLPNYTPETHLGGVLYLYVRGMAGPQTPREDGQPYGVFSWTPSSALVVALSDALDGRFSALPSTEGEDRA